MVKFNKMIFYIEFWDNMGGNMEKLKLTKIVAGTLVIASVLVVNPIGASAEWKQDGRSWWYTEGSSWAKGWRVIDGSLYYFDQKGCLVYSTPNEFEREYGLNGNGQFTNVTIRGAWAFCKLTGEIVAYVGSDSNVVIPDKIDDVAVTNIGNKAFYQCKSLTNITIPNSVKCIERSAFYGCTNLTSINISDSVKGIQKYAFSGCSSLTKISVDNNNTNYKSIDGVLYSKDGTIIECYPAGKGDENYTIPNGVTSIESSAFEGCTGLTGINIPDSVTSIEDCTFQDCTNLTNITIPNSVTSIKGGVFQGCKSLTSITIPDSVTSIESNSYKNIIFYVKSAATKQLLIKAGVNASKIVVSV